jgi:hypothetical protein
MEVIKYTGKFTPITEFFHYEFFEILPKDNSIKPEDKQTHDNRYDD